MGEEVGVGRGVGVGAGVMVDVGVGDVLGLGTGTPLSQISFLPLLMQVYFTLPDVWVCPSFEHAAPGFGGEAAVAVRTSRNKKPVRAITRLLFIALFC
jgi:hypothetical protein